MREKFICAHFVTSWHCKIGSKAHFFAATPPHLFRPKISVFPTFPRFEPDSGRFFKRSRSFFALRSPLFSRLSSFWSQLRTIFREIFPTFPSALPFLHCMKAFSFRAPSFFTPCTTFISRSTPPPPLIHPALHLLPPLSFSFLPTFPSPFPINERSRAPSRTTRVRLHIPTRQEVFVYCLHRFTDPSQSTGHQCVRCEGKQEKAFTKCTTTSQSKH